MKFTLKALCNKLEAKGWSTNVPGEGDHWHPHAWPPRRLDGEVYVHASRYGYRLERAGVLGPLEWDGEGGLCRRILIAAEDKQPVGDRSDYDV